MYLLPVLNLIMLAGIVVVIALAIFKKWKTVIILSYIIVLYFGSNLLFFETAIGRDNLHRHPLFRGKMIDIPLVSSVIIDGVLDEPCWQLQKHQFFNCKGRKTSQTPSFLFVQDKERLYLGLCYEADNEITFNPDLNKIMDFGITLAALLGDNDRKIRLLFEPFDDDGSGCGKSFCDCPKHREPEIYECASKVDGNKWMFEFSMPIDQVMGPGDKNLFFRTRFADTNISDDHICCYPAKNDRWCKYLRIKRSEQTPGN